jgi:hypothetical protein
MFLSSRQLHLLAELLVTNRRPLYVTGILSAGSGRFPRPEVSSGFMSEALSSITGSILGNIARY